MRTRTILAAVLAMAGSAAMADELDRRAPAGGVGARFLLELPCPGISARKQQEFVGAGFHLADRQRVSFRTAEFWVALVDYLSQQFPNDAGDHMSTANNAIAAAQKDVITAFVRHKSAAK